MRLGVPSQNGKRMSFTGKPHPPATPSKVKQTPLKKRNFNPSSGAVQAAYKDTEMIIRETYRESYWDYSIFVIPPLKKTYLKDYSVYVLNNLFSPAPSNGVMSIAARWRHTQTLPSAAMQCQCDEIIISL